MASDSQVTIVMVGLDAPEDLPATEIGDSQCSWTDFEAGRDALRLEQIPAEGDISGQGEALDIPSADQAILLDSGIVGSGGEATVKVIVGDQQLELSWPSEAAEGQTLVEGIATQWANVQSGSF